MCFIWLCVLDYRGRGEENIRIRDTHAFGGKSSSNVRGNSQGLFQTLTVLAVDCSWLKKGVLTAPI